MKEVFTNEKLER